MTILEIIARLAAIALLGAYLAWRHRRRVLATPPPPEDPSIWNHHGLEVEGLRPRVESVRRHYSAVLRGSTHRRRTLNRRSAWARRMVSGLSYFRHRQAQENTEHQVS